ncbi:MAG: hypothetical protein D6772_00100 [Bacteroidetes bacterium]|nr:MAG: hypothetical protein D6772_00100 [Bacteroidota bacterium]
MQKNDLEQFIDTHRDAFDDGYPSLKLWAAIEDELDGKKIPVKTLRPRRPWYQVAAAAVVLVALGGLGGHYLAQAPQALSTTDLLEQIAPEFREVEQYYQTQIQARYAQFASYTQDPEVDADLAAIDQAMAELREELQLAPPGREEQIVQELMDSYRLKLQLLEHILEVIQQQDIQTISTQNKSHERSI